MIIKFSDKFESIFYAILLNNLTGYFIYSKNDKLGLFEDEEHIDIDRINWRQILEEHNKKYGEIKWFNYNNPNFFAFKSTIEQILQKNNFNKYKKVIFLIKQSLKFGLATAKTGLTVPKAESSFKDKDWEEKPKKEEREISPLFIFDKKLI